MEALATTNKLVQLNLSHDLFHAVRKNALQVLEEIGLPPAKAEEYKFTPITRTLEKNFESLQPNGSPSNIEKNNFEIKALDADRIVFVNGVFNEKLSSVTSKDVYIQTLTKLKNENIISKIGTLAKSNTDSFVALNTATFQDGLFIEIKSNQKVERPIIIHHIADASQGKVVTATRNLIWVDENASVTVIEKYDAVGGAVFSSHVNEVFVAKQASFTYKLIQNDLGERYQFTHTVIHQQSNSHVNCFALCLNGKLIRNNLQLLLDGEHIHSHMYGLYLLNNDTLADNHTVADHMKPNSISNELYKGVMDGNAKGVFNGKIFVRQDAQKTNAFQSNRNILLSDAAGVNTKPQLEIWADDVKCSHGCTSGQLDEEALFYLQARGISKASAKALLLYAFAGEVIEKIENETIRNYIDGLVAERLNQNF
jgi:Fe-S cluster assembly protein SufD